MPYGAAVEKQPGLSNLANPALRDHLFLHGEWLRRLVDRHQYRFLHLKLGQISMCPIHTIDRELTRSSILRPACCPNTWAMLSGCDQVASPSRLGGLLNGVWLLKASERASIEVVFVLLKSNMK